jgi:chitodextrinase
MPSNKVSRTLVRGLSALTLGLLVLMPATPASASSHTNSTLLGASVSSQANLMAKTAQFGPLPIVRVYFPGLPPTNAWSSGLAGANASAVVVSFKALPTNIISGKDNGALGNFFDTAPTGHPIYYVYFHEPEDNIAHGQFTLADYLKAWTDVVRLADAAHNSDLHSTLVLMGFDVLPHSGRNWRSYFPPGNIISTISWDAYPPNGVGTPPPATFMGADVTAAKEAGLPFGFSEFATTAVSGRPAWLTAVGAYISDSGAIYGTLYDAGENGGLGGKGTFIISDAPSEHAWKDAVSRGGAGKSEPPSVPANLTGTAVSGSEVDLSWTASTDLVGVTGYRVYCNGAMAGTSVTPSYKDKDLIAATTYQFSVSAYDAAGNLSARTPSVSVTTPRRATPGVPTGLQATLVSETEVSLKWTEPTGGAPVTQYRIHRDGHDVGGSTTTSFTDTGLTPATGYRFSVSAYDSAGHHSLRSRPIFISTSGTTAPAPPTELNARAVSGREVYLHWSPPAGNVTVAGYDIYRDGRLAGTSGTSAYWDSGLTPATAYRYSVASYDAAGDVSVKSRRVHITTRHA